MMLSFDVMMLLECARVLAIELSANGYLAIDTGLIMG